MSGYRLSFEARNDLDDIRDYSRKLWGARRAAIYLARLRIALDLVGDRPQIGLVDDVAGARYRRHAVGSHLIFYRVAQPHVLVVRILHQQMDAAARL